MAQIKKFQWGGHWKDRTQKGESQSIQQKDATTVAYHINNKPRLSIKDADNYSDALGWIADWLSKRKAQLSNNERQYTRNDFLFNHDFGLLDVGQYVYDEDVKNMLRTPIIIDEREKDRYDIGNINNTYTYEDFPDIKHVIENQYSYGDKKYNIEDIKDYFNWTKLGHYKPYGKHIYIAPDGNESTLIHELNHSREAYPQEKAIYKNRKLQEGVELDDYLDKPTEIYSRLMEFRKANNINPEHKYTEEDLKKLKENAKDFDILNRYDDNTILYFLNDIAKNNINTYKTSNSMLAAFGGQLNHKKSDNKRGTLNYFNFFK